MKKAFSTLVGSSLLAASVAIASSAFFPANAASLTFTVENFTGDDAQAQITLEEIGDDIKFTIDVLNPPTTGDIRAVFFNILDDSLLSGLSVLGSDVTGFQFGPPGSVSDLGQGANINPKSFDAGIRIGTPGASPDFIPSTMFTLSHSSVALTLSQFFNQEFGVRLTSTTGPEGSSKLAGEAPGGGGGGDTVSVPEPATLGGLAFVAAALAMSRRRKIGNPV